MIGWLVDEESGPVPYFATGLKWSELMPSFKEREMKDYGDFYVTPAPWTKS